MERRVECRRGAPPRWRPFPAPPLKFRTAGFPQYGFKPAIRRRPSPIRAYTPPWKEPFAPDPLRVSRNRIKDPSGIRSVGPSTDPEALGSPAGYSVPPGHRLLWPHPRLCGSLASLSSSSCERFESQSFPNLPCTSLGTVPSSVPRRPGWLRLTVSSPAALAFAIFVVARQPQYPRKMEVGSRAGGSRGCKVRFMLRPGPWLALHRQGLLHRSLRS